ncbi:hypothetical protein [Rhodoferax antarcticus]|uniref:Transmembrane protein n=1 Tax=Rhodoferax antarcticus ANT.BR TaxID=1111071 RepID=A0A1Q8Y9B5_9BURK|nr:hypothetical protein [Rhodoferax antarcticus]OLP04593.1 hypothetical protein BLL52_4192 [Rhodoferax antarcticus ANT.BR]
MDFIKEKPKFVSIAERIIYGTLGVSALSTLFVFLFGPVEFPELLANMLLLGAVATLPYAMGRGSNKARFIYSGFTILSALIMFGTSDFIQNSPRFDLHIGVLLTPIELFVCGMLFTKESSEWFKKAKPVVKKAAE